MEKKQTKKGPKYSKASMVLGLVLILLAVVWASPIVYYQFLMKPELKVQIAPIIQASVPGMYLIIDTIFASPLPLLIFGIGLLWASRDARIGAVIFLLLQLVAILAFLNILSHGLDIEEGITISFSDIIDPEYIKHHPFLVKVFQFLPYIVSAFNGALVALLLIFRPRQAAK